MIVKERFMILSANFWCFCASLWLNFHLAAQAQRSHVSPDFFDVLETLSLRAGLAGVTPTNGIVPIRGPDRILFFLIDDCLVGSRVFSFRVVPTHLVVS